MPASSWNRKLHGRDGGFGRAIGYQELGAAITRGYAAAANDTGHQAPATDASWALGHPERVVDFGYRATHKIVQNAKAIIRSFYGQPPEWSYFSACSNGGRQALMEAERFPNDYNGIIAGAPSYNFTHLLTLARADLNVLLKDQGSYISAAKIPAIAAAVLSACDASDGLEDGLIKDPTQCRFDPSVLLCAATETDGCLTMAQIVALKQLYNGARDSKGNKIFAGYLPGGEGGNGGWALWITGQAPG